MTYTNQLPPARQFLSLAQHNKFPVTRTKILRLVKSIGSPETVIDFLRLYPANDTFKSRVDFMTRCKELEMFINQDHIMLKEILRSPQD